MKRAFILLSLSILIFACQPEGRIYSEFEDLSPELEWLKKDSREFVVPITDNATSYKMSIPFRYATGYSFPALEIVITETSPSGKTTTNNYSLPIVNEKGEYQGEPGLDIWDLEIPIIQNKKFEETGDYKFVIEHNMPADPVNFAMEIGLILDKVN